MPDYIDFGVIRYSDGLLVLGLTPPVPVGGQSIQFTITRRPGGTTPLVTKSVASGYNGASGVTVTASGIGVLRIALNAPETSGWEPGNYAYQIRRLDSGFITTLTEGFVTINL